MKFFIDTANIEDIREIAAWGVLSGVTTNPSLIAKEGKDFKSVINEICTIVDGPISAEVVSTETESMIKEGKEFASWHKNITVKLPTIPTGLAACKALSNEGIKVNMTLCFSATQAMLCASSGAAFVSPFIGRLDDIGLEGIQLIEDIAHIFVNGNLETEILAASIRTPNHITNAAKAGADIVTIPPKLFKQIIKHPLTDKGLELFLTDWNNAMLKKS